MEESLTYKSAMEEIENLVNLFEEVDDLRDNGKRSAVLNEFCKEKLHSTEEEVNKVLKSIAE